MGLRGPGARPYGGEFRTDPGYPISIRLPAELVEAIDEQVRRFGLDRSQYIRRLLTEVVPPKQRPK
jgi:hypothetical protein